MPEYELEILKQKIQFQQKTEQPKVRVKSPVPRVATLNQP